MSNLTKSEATILALISDNPYISQAQIAARLGVARSTVAVQITHLISKGYVLGRGYILPQTSGVTCIGGVAINRKYDVNGPAVAGTSNPADCTITQGGVVRNIAENLAGLDNSVSLLSVVGDDEAGGQLLSHARSKGIDVSQVSVLKGFATAEYVAIFDDQHELALGLANMDILDQITPDLIQKSESFIAASDWVIIDCNLPAASIAFILEMKSRCHFQLAIETVSISKAKRLPDDLSMVDILFTNPAEAQAILGQSMPIHDLSAGLRARGARGAVITNGAHGHLVDVGEDIFDSPALAQNVVNVSGAGDALVAGFISALRAGESLRSASCMGAAAAALTVETEQDVSDDIATAHMRVTPDERT